MAYMITDSQPSITTIKSFLGLNMNKTGETQLKLGEASQMKNFRITKDRKLEKMYGYSELYKPNTLITRNYVGKLGTKEVNCYVTDSKFYDSGTQKGTLASSNVLMFEWNQKLYIVDGTNIKEYDGTSFGDATGYVPTIKTACTPAGVGTDLEQINMLSMYRKVLFSGDGSAFVYHLPETGISDVSIKVNGETRTATVDSANGTITFGTPAPAVGTNNVEVQYKVAGSLGNVKNCKYYQKFGLADDTRLFTYGDSSNPNRIYFSDLDITGVSNPLYFPANNFIDVGSSNEAATDISRQYDRLIVSKPSECYYMVYEPITDTEGNTIIAFPTYPLNKSHGMLAYAQGQVLDNYITTIDNSGIIQWTNTNTKDERNAVVISERVNEWLQSKDLTKAITLDHQEEKEYWIAIDKEILVYNYANSTFALLRLPDNVRTLTMYKGEIYMGTDTSIMKWDTDKTTYNGELIDAEWYSGFYDFEAEYKRKTMRILWITLKPQIKTYMAINYITDRNSGVNDREFSSFNNEVFSYPFWNYADFTYNCNTYIKPVRIKLKAKKFAFLQLVIKSNKIDHKLIVDSISIQKSYIGFVK